MDETRDKIVSLALDLFKQYGLRSVSVDDICKQMGMSKKTFYRYFNDKEALIAAVLEMMNDNVNKAANKYMEGKSALECMSIIMNMHTKVSDVHKEPPLRYDLEKYYPKLYKQHINNVHRATKDILMRHLQQGKEEGVYREDLDIEMCAVMFSLIQQGFIRNEEEIKTVSPRRLINFALDSFFRSIVSEAGGKQVKELLNQNNKNKV